MQGSAVGVCWRANNIHSISAHVVVHLGAAYHDLSFFISASGSLAKKGGIFLKLGLATRLSLSL